MDVTPTTRQSLLTRLRDLDDSDAWIEFVQIYEPFIYAIARKRGLQYADAADLCQEVLSSVAGQIENWVVDRSRGSFRAWLFTVARNRTIDLFQRRQRPRTAGASTIARILSELDEADGSDSTNIEFEFQRRIFRWAARCVRVGFRDDTWQAFWMTAVEGEPITTAAESLNLSAGAVYIARSRVMAGLKREIERVEGKAEP